MLSMSEQGLYFFLARSDKPKALPFQKWIAGDVLPSIRKTGGYSVKPQKLPSASSYIKVYQHIKQTLSQAGLAENQQLLATNKSVAKLTGFDLLSTAGITYLPSPDNDEYLIPEQVGQRLNPKIGSREVNIRLLNLGLQVKKHDGKGYVPTPKGKAAGGRMMDVSKANTDGTIQHLKWRPSIIDVLQNGMKEGD